MLIGHLFWGLRIWNHNSPSDVWKLAMMMIRVSLTNYKQTQTNSDMNKFTNSISSNQETRLEVSSEDSLRYVNVNRCLDSQAVQRALIFSSKSFNDVYRKDFSLHFPFCFLGCQIIRRKAHCVISCGTQ